MIFIISYNKIVSFFLIIALINSLIIKLVMHLFNRAKCVMIVQSLYICATFLFIYHHVCKLLIVIGQTCIILILIFNLC